MSEHDQQCARQEVRLAVAAEQIKALDETLLEVSSRTQLLVDQFHAQNVAQAEIKGDVQYIRMKVVEIEESLQNDFALRSEFVEVKGEWRTFLRIVLATVLAGVLSGGGWLWTHGWGLFQGGLFQGGAK